MKKQIYFWLLLTFFSFNISAEAQNMALDFDGSADYVEVPFNAAINPVSFTIETWFKSDATGGDQSIITSRESIGAFGTSGYIIYLSPTTNELTFWTGNYTVDGWDILSSGYNVPTGEWTHVSCTYNGSNRKEIFINGLLIASNDIAATYGHNLSKPLRIGAGATETSATFFLTAKLMK